MRFQTILHSNKCQCILASSMLSCGLWSCSGSCQANMVKCMSGRRKKEALVRHSVSGRLTKAPGPVPAHLCHSWLHAGITWRGTQIIDTWVLPAGAQLSYAGSSGCSLGGEAASVCKERQRILRSVLWVEFPGVKIYFACNNLLVLAYCVLKKKQLFFSSVFNLT